MKTPNEPGWFDKPANVDKIVYAVWIICGLLVLAEFFYEKHPHFAAESWFGFYAGYGFLAYCFIVLSAKALRRLLKRSEDYYGE